MHRTISSAARDGRLDYQLLGATNPVVTRNLRWLAGYRHPRYLVAEIAARLCGVVGEPVALIDAEHAAGDPIATLPVLYHLWRHVLTADLTVPRRTATPVAMRLPMSGWPAVLRPGDWVTFNGDEHQVVATAIGELLTVFWSTIAGMCHEWRHRWTVDETTAVLETPRTTPPTQAPT